jgi:putative oxidoreductase
MSTNATGLEAPLNGALWVIQVLGAILATEVGLAKSDNEQLIQSFASIGIGEWLSYVMRLIALVSAALLLIPTLCGIGALLLAVTMIVTILANVFITGGSQTLPIGLLIFASVVAWGRKKTILQLLGRNST